MGAATLITIAASAASPSPATEIAGGIGEGSLASVPPAARATISGVLGRGNREYHARATSSGFQSTNSSHGLVADFRQGGVVVRAGSAGVGLRLRSVGYGSRLSPVAPAQPRARSNRVEYSRGPITEWYANGPLGLEQGFTLAAPQPGALGLSPSSSRSAAPSRLRSLQMAMPLRSPRRPVHRRSATVA